MIRHCVMFRWKDGTSPATIGEVEAALAKLPDAIPAIAAYTFGRDIAVNSGNYEFAVVADFATLDDYLVYRDHPDHKQVIVDLIVPNIAERAAVQFETTR
jgi:Stress responsive A/B Barrel Domain